MAKEPAMMFMGLGKINQSLGTAYHDKLWSTTYRPDKRLIIMIQTTDINRVGRKNLSRMSNDSEETRFQENFDRILYDPNYGQQCEDQKAIAKLRW